MTGFLTTMFFYVWLGYVLVAYQPDDNAMLIIFDGLLVTILLSACLVLVWLML